MNSSTIWSPCAKPGYAYCAAAKWIWATVIPFLCVVGTLGNALSLAVLLRIGLRSKTITLYLISLTLANILFILTAFLRNILLQTCYIDMKIASVFSCKVHEWVVSASAMVTVWSIVMLTKERLMVTMFPLLARRTKFKMYAKVSNAVIVSTSIMVCCHFAFGNELQQPSNMGLEGDGHIVVDEICGPSNLQYKQFLSGPWVKIKLYLMTLVPCVIIAGGNAIIACILWRSRRKTHPQVMLIRLTHYLIQTHFDAFEKLILENIMKN